MECMEVLIDGSGLFMNKPMLMLREKNCALPNFCHMHMFWLYSIIYIYLSSWYFSLYLFAYLSSIRGKQMHLGVKCNRVCLCIFSVQSDSQSIIIYKSMNTLTLIHNLVNQHSGNFILNHQCLHPGSWFVGEGGREATTPNEKTRKLEGGRKRM